MNVLLTSVGRRAYMVQYFKQAVAPYGKVHVCNSDDLTVAFQYADHSVISPLIYSEEYIPFLLHYCEEQAIDMIISLFDIDLPVLAKNKDRFEAIGTRVIVSDAALLEICNDKWRTYEFLKKNGFFVPKTYLTLQSAMLALESGEIHYPVIVKPRFGCGSLAMSVAEDEMALLYYYTRNTRAVRRTYLKYESDTVEEKIIFQEMLAGQEYGIDIINDLEGRFCNAIVKKKLAMRAGETDIGETVEEPTLFAEAERLGKLTKHIGNMDCDFFLVDGRPYVLEMNARFGGGYPFSHVAGCDLPRVLVNWVSGRDVLPAWLTAKSGVRAYKELILTTKKG